MTGRPAHMVGLALWSGNLKVLLCAEVVFPQSQKKSSWFSLVLQRDICLIQISGLPEDQTI